MASLAILLAACSGAPAVRSEAPSSSSSAPPSGGSPSAVASPSPSPAIASHALPAGGLIAHERGETSRLGIVGSDGTDARELVPGFRGELLSVDWSPDGTKVVFYQLIPRQIGGIYETDASGSTPQLLDLGCLPRQGLVGCDEDDWPSYSPDGRRLAVVRWKGVWDTVNEPPPNSTVIVLADRATGQSTELASTELPFGQGVNFKPRWSPDGTRLVFHRVHSDESGPVGSELWVVSSDGSDLQQITPADVKAGDADWSPDGSLIVFSSQPLWSWAETAVGPIYGQDIYTIRPDGTGLSRLTDDEHSATPRWTPDGSRILFARLSANAANTKTLTDFWLMGPTGSDPHPITSYNDCCWWYGDMQPLPSP
jgi:Tol biopolymer transport system component